MLSSCVATCSHDCSFARQSTCTPPPRPAPRGQARHTVGRPAARDGQQRRAALAPRPANPCAAPQAADPGGARVLLDAGRDPPACCAGGSPAQRPSLLRTHLANPVWWHAPTGAARSDLPQRAGCGHGDPTVVRSDASDSASSSMAVSSMAAGSPLRRDCRRPAPCPPGAPPSPAAPTDRPQRCRTPVWLGGGGRGCNARRTRGGKSLPKPFLMPQLVGSSCSAEFF